MTTLTKTPQVGEAQIHAYQKHDLAFLVAMSGYCILAIVLWHVRIEYWNDVYAWGASLYDLDLAGRFLELLLLSPIAGFVFIAGFRFQYSLMRYEKYVAKDGSFRLQKYASTRLRRLMIPYVIWSLIYLCIAFATGSAKAILQNQSLPPFITGEQVPGLLLGTGNLAYQLWFLPMLLIVSLTVVVLRHVLKRPLLIYLLFSLNILLEHGLGLNYFPLSYWLSFLLVFELGVACALYFYRQGRLPSPNLILTLWAVVTVAALFNRTGGLQGRILVLAVTNITPVACYILAYHLSQSSAFTSVFRFFKWVGQYSWPIFLLHAPFLTSWTVNLLKQFGLYTYWTLLPIALGISLLCILIYRVLVRANTSTNKIFALS